MPASILAVESDVKDVSSMSTDDALDIPSPNVPEKSQATEMDLDEDSSEVSRPLPSVESPPLALSTNVNHDQQTVIIFDWDDTLLASTCLHQKGYRLDNVLPPCEEVDSGLQQLQTAVVSVLNMALQFGPVSIVTNAETGWVHLSAQKWMPAVSPLLEKVHVVSARSTYETEFPEAPLKWKYQAMHSRLGSLFSDETASRSRHVISFGDSHVEREAVRQVTKEFRDVRCKSVKFAERPTMEQLRRQIDLVASCFQYIYTHDGDLDLMLTISLMS